MAHKTYLQLVNDAMAECKVTIQPLDSTTFPSATGTMLYNLFKTWTNRAYRDILISRDEWNYRVERASVLVYPRLQVRMSAANVVNINDVLIGDSSGVSFKVLDIHSAEDVELDTAAEYTLSVDYVDGETTASNLIFNETFSRTSPSPASAIGSVKGRGVYDFHELVPYVYEVDDGSFYMQNYPLTSDAPRRLVEITYDRSPVWGISAFDTFSASMGTTEYVFRTPDGKYDFYPRINTPRQVSFSYSQEIKLMSLYNDTPVLIDEKYDDLIMWKTIAYYADWDERGKLYARANKEIKRWNFLMDKNELPVVTFNTRRFDYGHI